MFRKSAFVLLLILPATVFAQLRDNQPLQKAIIRELSNFDGKVGIGICGLDFADTLMINDNHHYPMQSVFKFPLGIYILDMVDKGKLALEQKINIKRSDLQQKTWSPMLKDFKGDSFTMTVAELLQYSVAKSDNNACDILFEVAGGTKPVDDYFKAAGVKNMAIVATEYEMTKAWDVQYTNFCHPSAMVQVITLFYNGRLLKPATNRFMMKLMVESENPSGRLKGMLPENTIVGHKTGTGSTNDAGITSATNDVGFVTLPNGRHYAIVVYVSDYKGAVPVGEKMIAKISRLVWEHYTKAFMNETKQVTPQVSRTIIPLLDTARMRPIDIAVYLPKDAKSIKGVVMLNHGYDPGNLSAHLSYSYIANYLAERKYMVVSILHDMPWDTAIAREGNLQKLRYPFWEQGSRNIQHVLKYLENNYPGYDFKKVSLVGHSNGGDIAALYAKLNPHKVSALITLDNRRMALPRNGDIKVCSLRSSDFPADDGVLPGEDEQKKYGAQIVFLPATKHNDMDDDATAEQQAEMLNYIYNCLSK